MEQTADDLQAHAQQQGRTLATYIRQLRGGAYLQHFGDALREYKGSGCECGSGSPAAVRRSASQVQKGKGVETRPVSVEIVNQVAPTPSPDAEPAKKKRVVSANDKRRVRGAVMSKLMKEKGMYFAEASRHIKANVLV